MWAMLSLTTTPAIIARVSTSVSIINLKDTITVSAEATMTRVDYTPSLCRLVFLVPYLPIVLIFENDVVVWYSSVSSVQFQPRGDLYTMQQSGWFV